MQHMATPTPQTRKNDSGTLEAQSPITPSILIRPRLVAGKPSPWPFGIWHVGIPVPAPFPIARTDLRKSPKRALPTPLTNKGKCPRPKPGSDDCFLYMRAQFFAYFLGAKAVDHRMAAKLLEESQAPAPKKNTWQEEFLAPMVGKIHKHL